jgi:peptidoglycan/xylan/chitin deacetylase (PgdA/CDA1 family)
MFVLNFHCIGTPRRALTHGEHDVCLGRQQFLDVLDAVAGRDDVRLTFDDGNKSDLTEALPALMQRGLRAEFFICPARLGCDGFLAAADVRELRRAGMSIGSHGMDHVPWRKLKEPEIHREIVQAKDALEDVLQVSVDTAACPFGAYDRRTLNALRSADFKRVYTSDGGPAGLDDWLVARNTVRRTDSPEAVARMLNGSNGTVSLPDSAKRWTKRWR